TAGVLARSYGTNGAVARRPGTLTAWSALLPPLLAPKGLPSVAERVGEGFAFDLGAAERKAHPLPASPCKQGEGKVGAANSPHDFRGVTGGGKFCNYQPLLAHSDALRRSFHVPSQPDPPRCRPVRPDAHRPGLDHRFGLAVRRLARGADRRTRCG